MTGSKVAAMGRAEVRKVGHIGVSVAAGRDTGMNVTELCAVQLTETARSVESYGSVDIAERVHCASTLVLVGEVDHESG